MAETEAVLVAAELVEEMTVEAFTKEVEEDFIDVEDLTDVEEDLMVVEDTLAAILEVTEVASKH